MCIARSAALESVCIERCFSAELVVDLVGEAGVAHLTHGIGQCGRWVNHNQGFPPFAAMPSAQGPPLRRIRTREVGYSMACVPSLDSVIGQPIAAKRGRMMGEL